MLKFTLFILVTLLVTCSRADRIFSHVTGNSQFDEFLHNLLKIAAKDNVDVLDKSIYQEIREIRATTDSSSTVKAWIDSDINACSTPNSKISNFCSISYTTPTILINRVSKLMEVIIDGFANVQSSFGTSCANIAKEVLCKGVIPQCSSNRTVATYGNFASSCAGMAACSPNLVSLNGQTGAQICAGQGRQLQLTTCSRYNVGAFDATLCGQLPSNITFPSWMVTNLPSQSLSIRTLKATLERAQVNQDCVNKWVKLVCVNVPFCSADKKKILTAVSKQQCESAISCLPGNIQTALKRVYDCATYPDQGSATITISANMGYSSHAISVAVGSAMLYFICLLLSILS